MIIFKTVNVSSNLPQILLSKSQSVTLALVEERFSLVFTNKAVCVLISWQACQGFLGYIKVFYEIRLEVFGGKAITAGIQ